MLAASVPRIAWIGVGHLGSAVVLRLLERGVDVGVWNRDPRRSAPVVQAGAQLLEKPADALAAPLVMLCVKDGAAVQAILNRCIAEFDGQWPTIVDLTTMTPGEASGIRERIHELGGRYLSCPVSGGPEGAIGGKLAACASGSPAAWRHAEHTIRNFASFATFVGERSEALTIKVANNLAEAANLWGAAECVSLIESSGIAIEQAMPVLEAMRGWSKYMGVLLSRAGKPDHEVSVPIGIRVKDLNCAKAIADRTALDLPLAKELSRLFARVADRDGSGLDQTACLSWLRQHG